MKKIKYSWMLAVFVTIGLLSAGIASAQKPSEMPTLLEIWTGYLNPDKWPEISRSHVKNELSNLDTYVNFSDFGKGEEERAMKGAQQSSVVPDDTETRFYRQYGDGFLEVDFPFGEKIYKLKGSLKNIGIGYLGAIGLSYHPFGGTDSIRLKGSYFNVNNKPVKCVVVPVTAGLSVTDVERLHFSFSNKGKNEFNIILGDKTFTFSFEVVELPFEWNASEDNVIETLGFPTNERSVYTSWPDKKNHDGVNYSPSSGAITAKHYYYEAYPFMAVSIVNSHVYGVGNMFVFYRY